MGFPPNTGGQLFHGPVVPKIRPDFNDLETILDPNLSSKVRGLRILSPSWT